MFINVLKENSYLSSNGKIDNEIEITFVAGILVFLRNNGIIKSLSAITIINAFKDEFNYTISTSSFSIAHPYPIKDSQEHLFKNLSKVYDISY